jgi:hypothetical protein
MKRLDITALLIKNRRTRGACMGMMPSWRTGAPCLINGRLVVTDNLELTLTDKCPKCTERNLYMNKNGIFCKNCDFMIKVPLQDQVYIFQSLDPHQRSLSALLLKFQEIRGDQETAEYLEKKLIEMGKMLRRKN